MPLIPKTIFHSQAHIVAGPKTWLCKSAFCRNKIIHTANANTFER